MFYVIVNANSIAKHVIQIKNEIIINVKARVKKYRTCNKDYSWNPSTYICENSRDSKSIAHDPVIACDEIICVIESVSSNVTNIISINYDDKIVVYRMDCNILCTFLFKTTICYHYARKGQSKYLRTNSILKIVCTTILMT